MTAHRCGTPARRAFVATPLLAALLLVTLGSAGCARGGAVAPDVDLDRGPHPVVAVAQAATVLDAVSLAMTRSRVETSARDVGPRVLGPYRDLSVARARVAAARERKVPAPGQFSLITLLVPRATDWPRFFVAVGDVQGESTPRLRVLTSAGPREPYGVWAQAAMLPGATLPQVAGPGTGTDALDPRASSGLVLGPAEAVTRYAAYLTDEGRGAPGLFRRSSYSDQVIQRLRADRSALRVVATVRSTHEPADSAPLALRTSDGGALVVGQLTQTYTLRTKDGRRVALTDPNLRALAGGKASFGRFFTRTSVQVVVLRVPPVGGGPISVVAADKGDVKAVAR